MSFPTKNVLPLFLLLLVLPGAAQAQTELESFQPELTARDLGGLIEGSAQTEVGEITFKVDYALKDYTAVTYSMNGKQITWTIDLTHEGSLSLRGYSLETGAIANMEKRDAVAFEKLNYTFEILQPKLARLRNGMNEHALDQLTKTAELLSTYSIGLPIDGQKKLESSFSITSLCHLVGSRRTAVWDANGTTHAKSFVVGGHGVCKGHCGGGCPSGARSYTQDCLNHDACVGEENACARCPVGVCGDEWWSASDDYVRAPDCN